MKVILVNVKASAKKNEIISYENHDGSNYILKLSVKQAPENGKANEAVIKLLSKTFDIRSSEIKIVSGFTNSFKKVQIPLEIAKIFSYCEKNKKVCD